MNAYDEGYKAFYDGKGFDDNPYLDTDPDNDKWESGYTDADIYESGEIDNDLKYLTEEGSKQKENKNNMSYLTDMYGKRDSDFIKGFLAAMNTYAVWHNGKRFIGSPEQELHSAIEQAITELGDDSKNYSEFLML